MEALRYILAALCAYFIGNVQTAILLSRFVFKDDVREHGSGNAGATNMLRVFGLRAGLVTFAGDFLKAVLAIVLGRLIGGSLGGYIAGLFVVVGHDFPVLFWMKGGKGVASTVAVAYMVSPLMALVGTVVGVGLILLTKMVSLGGLVGVSLFVILTFIRDWGNAPLLILVSLLWILVVLRHKDNIERLVKGRESKLEDRPKP